jgi:fructose-specific component phosphotransferase system IIB-like protein
MSSLRLRMGALGVLFAASLSACRPGSFPPAAISAFELPSRLKDRTVQVFVPSGKFDMGDARYIDETPALYLDFTSQYDRLLGALDETVCTAAGGDTAAYKAALETLKAQASKAKQEVVDLNKDYNTAVIAGDTAKADSLMAKAKELNKKNLKAFKYAQDEFLGLMYEAPVVPHEAPQSNIDLMQNIVTCLKAGDVVKAADEYAWQVNNVLEWYNMYFSPEVSAQFNEMFWGKDNQDNLFWGTGRNFTPANVEAATRGLMDKYETAKPDLTAEIAVYEKAIKDQQTILKTKITEETAAMIKLADMLK